MTSSPHGPYGPGYTRDTMVTTRAAKEQSGANLKKLPQFGLYSATRVHEVGIASNRRSEEHTSNSVTSRYRMPSSA